MPELPEVEIYRRYVERHAIGRRIDSVQVLDRRVLERITPPALQRVLHGRMLTGTRRHGKHLFVATGGGPWLHLHFGMTGDVISYRDAEQGPRFARVVLRLSRGSSLAFDDPRIFGRIGLVDSPEAYVEEKRLGPDPLEAVFTPREFRRRLADRRGAVKPLLMSQQIVAGLGNLYVDETLFQTSVHPLQRADVLTLRSVTRIHNAIRRILKTVIERKSRGADYPASYLIPHRIEGEPCPKCGGEIRRSIVGGRTTYHCERHQRLQQTA